MQSSQKMDFNELKTSDTKMTTLPKEKSDSYQNVFTTVHAAVRIGRTRQNQTEVSQHTLREEWERDRARIQELERQLSDLRKDHTSIREELDRYKDKYGQLINP
eukprot:TRINITY_DN11499_c0_g2_i1.p1 TRINITY_DN11499_c0_g2~~TRINITY_DN11499_c0_g2_i1.p1  ORF type:complete len:104 (-),score=22.01 TRINITY_DN11499_c0_g2_i1:83-394(-)